MGSDTKILVLASSGSSDEVQELNSIKSEASIVSQDFLGEIIEKAINLDEYVHIHIETTRHSYYKLAEIMTDLCITGDFLYIDEVKNTMVGEDSIYAECLFDKHAPWTVRIGADANLVDLIDNKGIHDPTSLGNKNTWRTVGVKWEEIEATSRGWKRNTIPEVSIWDIRNLSHKLSNMITDKQNGVIIKDAGFTVNLEWRLALESLVIKLLNCDRKFPLLKVNSVKRAKLFEEYATKVWPLIIKQHGDARSPAIKRLLSLSFVSIYREGNSHNKIINFVENIPTHYPNGACVIQVKKLNEGWDPTDGWIDLIQFVDSSSSRTLISQLVGRGARNDPFRKYTDLPVSMIKIIDSEDEYSIPYMFNQVQAVCDALGVGENINDTVTMHDYTNKGNPGSVTSRGSKSYRGIYTQGGFLPGYKGFTSLGRYNPYLSVVEELYHTYNVAWNHTYNNNLKRQALSLEIMNNEKFIEFLQQYKDPAARRSTISKIIQGNFFLLPYALRKEAKRNYKKITMRYKKNLRGDAYTHLVTMGDVTSIADISDYVGLKLNGIVTKLNTKVKENNNLDDTVRYNTPLKLSYNVPNNRLLRNYPITGKILEKSFQNLIDNFIIKVREQENLAVSRIKELQQLTTVQSFSGTMKGTVIKIALDELNMTQQPNTPKLTSVATHSLNKCEQFAKKNQKLIVEYIEKNYKNYTNRKDQWEATMEFANDNNLIHSLSNEKINNLCPNKEEIETYYRLHAGRYVADNRKDYVNPAAKTFVAEGVEYESAGQANRAIEVRDVRILAKYRSDVYYFKEDGPTTPKKIRFHNTPHGNGPKTGVYDLCKTAGEEYASQYLQGSVPRWWNKVSTLYPEEFFVEDRIATKEEILQNRMSLASMVRMMSEKG